MTTLISAVSPATRRQRLVATARLYLQLTKPRVVTLIAFTAVVGMVLATPDGLVALNVLALATTGIALAASSAAAFNHALEREGDAVMARTRARPLPTGSLERRNAFVFATVLAVGSIALLATTVNLLTAALTFASMIGYSLVYTLLLKPATSQNIVIGGAAGATPPVLGWTAVTGEVALDALLLFLIVFLWTPPHFWALALYRADEYARAGIPMLPVTHGSAFTRRCIFGYTLALVAVTVLPFAIAMSGWVYLIGALALGARFTAYAWKLMRSYSDPLARRTFAFSIQYLAALFALLLIDHVLAGAGLGVLLN